MLPLTLACLLLANDPHPIPGRALEAHDLATLTHVEARRLEGRRVRFVVEVTSLPGDHPAAVLFDVATVDGNHTLGTLWLPPGTQLPPDGPFVVEGTLRLLWRPAFKVDGLREVPAYWEYRIEAARVVH